MMARQRTKNVLVGIRTASWEMISQAEGKESGDSHLLRLQPGSKWYMRRHIFTIILVLHIFKFSFSGEAVEMRTFLFVFKPSSMPSVLKDGVLLNH